MKKKLLSYLLNFVLVAAVYGVLMGLNAAGVLNNFYMGVAKLIMINALLAVSLNLVTGFLGQLALGHAGFMAAGAYTSALITLAVGGQSGMPTVVVFLLSLLAGGLVAAVFGVIIGIPALRLRGDYLAILTLGFGEIIRVLINGMEFTGGPTGLKGIPNYSGFTVVFIVCAVGIALITMFINSRHGRAVKAIRDNEIAAEACGVHVTFYKLLAFVIAAFFAGVAGGLFAHHISAISPAKFNFDYSIEILVMVVLGGMGSITGSVIAAVILTLLPQVLQDFSQYRMIAYSLLLIIMMLFRPKGLLGQYEFSIGKSAQWVRSHISRSGRKARKEGEQ